MSTASRRGATSISAVKGGNEGEQLAASAGEVGGSEGRVAEATDSCWADVTAKGAEKDEKAAVGPVRQRLLERLDAI